MTFFKWLDPAFNAFNRVVKPAYPKFSYHFFCITAFIVFLSAGSAFLPLILKTLVDSANAPKNDFNFLYFIGALYGLIWFVSQSLQWLQGAITSYFLASIEGVFYKSILTKIYQANYLAQQQFDSGVIYNDIRRSGTGFGQVIHIIGWTLVPILFQIITSLFILSANIGIGFSVFVTVSIVLVFFISLLVAQMSSNMHKIIFQADNTFAQHAINRLSFLFEQKTNGTYQYETKKLTSITKDYVNDIFKANKMAAKLMVFQLVIMGVLLISSNIYLVYKLSNAELTAGAFVLVSGSIIQLSTPIIMLAQLLLGLKGHLIAIDDSFKYLNLTSPPSNHQAVPFNKHELLYEIEDMHIQFARKNVSLHIGLGAWYTIIGESGSGKSTLIKNLLRLLNDDAKTFNIFGVASDKVLTENLLDEVSVVNQKSILFDGSLLENLMYGSSHKIDKINIEKILSALNLEKFIGLLSCDHSDWVNNVSGGEAQRLAICRAVLKGKDIIILDEATSSLDSDNEKIVLDYIRAHFNTVIFASHSDKVIEYSDYIIDMNQATPSSVKKSNTNGI